jgi:hypothetical protein
LGWQKRSNWRRISQKRRHRDVLEKIGSCIKPRITRTGSGKTIPDKTTPRIWGKNTPKKCAVALREMGSTWRQSNGKNPSLEWR